MHSRRIRTSSAVPTSSKSPAVVDMAALARVALRSFHRLCKHVDHEAVTRSPHTRRLASPLHLNRLPPFRNT